MRSARKFDEYDLSECGKPNPKNADALLREFAVSTLLFVAGYLFVVVLWGGTQ